ncbi:YagU family protein [Rothia nasisuis]|uniref:YagU family protein n=1 Tax=Rothia nasisuis TaxID=2109647 RepID=UPI001F28C114|nr:YagU family protein [Rothia nasisuis]
MARTQTADHRSGAKLNSPVTFSTITDPVRRRLGVATLVGLIAGIFSGIVKFGWEVPFPPRTPERNATNPPQALLELLGMSPETSHATYSYLGNELPYWSFAIHFAFAIFFAVAYCLIAEYWPSIKLWQGAVFGVVLYVAFHVVLMPAMGLVPAPWDQPFGEHFSEFFGHIVWLWSIEIVRRDLRNRITGQPDAEYSPA